MPLERLQLSLHRKSTHLLLCGGGDATIFNTLRNKIQLIYSAGCTEADTFSSQHNQNCQCWTNRQLSQLCRFESAHMTHIVKSCAPQPRLHECMCDCVSYRCVHCSCIEGMCVFAFVRLWPLLFHQGNQIWNCSFFFLWNSGSWKKSQHAAIFHSHWFWHWHW